MAKAERTYRASKSLADLTPAMRQYVEQKASVGDAILLFRMGDFYETFYEDAETASRVLGIALTSRDRDTDHPTPLAGIPYHALDGYLAKLVRAGFKVAISEQVEDPKQAKGVVKREIVRVVTPGTLTDDALLDERADRLLAAVCLRGDAVGLACLDLASGHLFVEVLAGGTVLDELVRWRPAELLIPQTGIDRPNPVAEAYRSIVEGATITERPAHRFEPHDAERTLHAHFGVTTLAGFGFDSMDVSLCAAGALLDYVRETQKTAAQHVLRIARRESAEYVQIDQATWRSLEIECTLRGRAYVGSLLHAVDRTANPMGARTLRRWLRAPLRSIDAVERRLDAVADLRGDRDRLAGLRRDLRELGDLERVTARLGVGRASPRDLAAVRRALAKLPGIRGPLAAHPTALVGELVGRIDELPELRKLLDRGLKDDPPLAVTEGGLIADGHDAELDRLRAIATGGQEWLGAFQARQAERTGIGNLKVGFNQVFGYYIEVSHANRERVPADYVRKQTLKNAERYITDELKQHETEVLTARDRANELEYQLFEALRAEAAKRIPALQQTAEALGQLDALAGLAELSYERSYTRPELVEAPVVEVSSGRHPVLESTLGEGFVPNDGRLDADGERLVLLTGPNMAGKSTYIRQMALLALLAQTGSYVPAGAMKLGPVDRVFARVGATDEIARGQSTFMVEMTEAANILNNATPRSLVILDEIGRGTSTFDGLALAWAVTEHLASKTKCRVLFATHYHELTELAELLEGVRNCNVAVREYKGEIIFLHKIADGPASQSYGVHVARLAGVPPAVVERAAQVLEELERGFERESHGTGLAAARTRHEAQMWLFNPQPAPDPIRERIRELDLDHMTPMEALAKLKELQAEGGANEEL